MPRRGEEVSALTRLGRFAAVLPLLVLVAGAAPVAEAAAPPPPKKSAPAPPRTSSVAAAPSANPYHLKPGAQGKICLNCHSDIGALLALPFVHAPVKAGDCVQCHSPHASSHGKLLSAGPETICATCHAPLSAASMAKARSVHPPVRGGECIRCHDPHAAKNKGQLRLTGSELCASCHAEMLKRVTTVKFRHPPVAASCLACHDPHASDANPHLLKKPVPALCTQCHKTDQLVFAKQHMNYPVGKADCTSCHDPHGSDRGGLLWATVHPPVANRMCNQCHLDPASPGALLTRKTGAELCRSCHAEMVNTALARNRVHWPAVDRIGCLNCHNPHASPEPALLKAKPKALCASCHGATVADLDRSAVKHPPAEEGQCTVCHDPHAANAVFLLKSDKVMDLCGTCHDYQHHSNHPIGEKKLDPRNRNLTLDCTSCHRPHGSPFKSFAHFDPDSNLCVQCHQGMGK
jgi:predicted CXXCH cytochrome family protein